MQKSKTNMTMSHTTAQSVMKNKMAYMDSKLKEALTENEKHVNQINKSEKEIKLLREYQDKLKQHLKKKINKGKMVDNGIRQCKNCLKEFSEKENYNWSCRVHQSEWGGEMWWCCGKRDKDHPGCKFSKHETKEDDVLPDDNGHIKNLKNTKCTACRDMGHSIEYCYKDPNFKTMQDVGID